MNHVEGAPPPPFFSQTPQYLKETKEQLLSIKPK